MAVNLFQLCGSIILFLLLPLQVSCNTHDCCNDGHQNSPSERSERYEIAREIDSFRLSISYYYMFRKAGLPDGNVEVVIQQILSKDDFSSQYLKQNCPYIVGNPKVATILIEYRIIDDLEGNFYLSMIPNED